MFKKVNAYAPWGDRTGYQIHSKGFFDALEKRIAINRQEPYDGDVSVSLLDSVSAQHEPGRRTFPSILYNVWESTQQPQGFMDALRLYDQLWVPSEWQRQCTIDQGVNAEFVKVVPEGIDPELYHPIYKEQPSKDYFRFIIVGKWEYRKSTREMIQCWLNVFKDVQNVQLWVMADNPFPVDEYRTTEDRLKGYGLESDKIRIVPFVSKDSYVHILQTSHVFLSCSRAEGWNLPLIEAMACGIPAVALDWSGSTEFAKDAMLVRVKEFKKPEHVYGMPDCPGLWAEPDFDHFKEVIKDAYDNWDKRWIKALATSEYIRREFSWDKAADKAMVVLQEIEDNTKAMAAETKDQIFCIGCWPNSEEKMATLVETINQVKFAGFPVLITSHYALPPSVIEMADYYIYDKRNELSGDWRATYFRTKDGKQETAKATIPYHAVAVLHSIRNAIDFCADKFKTMHYMEYDVEFDLRQYLDLWRNKPAEKEMLALSYENRKDAIQSCLFSANIDWLYDYFPRVNSWDEYISDFGEDHYVLENWLIEYAKGADILNDIEIVDYPITNRFDQVDRGVWKDDIFSVQFLNGPQLTISGLSRREYEVVFSNPVDGEQYRTKQKVGTWSSPATKFFREWEVKAYLDGELKFEHKFDLKGKRVILAMGSKALGDTMAWVPYFEEFRKKHDCHVIASTWWNGLFDYPEIEWAEPGSSHNDIYAAFEVGCFDGDMFKNPRDWRSVRMQEIATDILGLEYKEVHPQMKKVEPMKFGAKHFCFSEHSTMKAKLWNRDGAWQEVIDYLRGLGYEAVSISKEPTGLKNVVAQNNKPIEETIAAMNGAEFYIGLGAGPSWLAWGCGLPVVMISGFSEPWCEYDSDFRIMPPEGICKGCFNDTSVKFDRGWTWCPQNKDYACTKEITAEKVIETINKLIGGK
jgi:autotransporter strand-loop-strand O-heptosyltransferase